MQVIAGKYGIVREIGEGGTGKVYLVRHVDLDVSYALKILSPRLSSDERFIERFKQEASILIRFSHPQSVQVRDFGRTEDGLYYMAMDFCEGQLLKDYLESKRYLSVAESLHILNQLLDVLKAAHAFGIIHRDIKPDNIMLDNMNSQFKSIKILDFGIAKIRETMELDSTTTLEGVTIGTPQYMSPEQASGESDLDHRVDLYSVGVLMYEILTGQLPFKGDTVIQTLLMHLTRPPEPFNKVAPDLQIPEVVEELVFKALEKEKAKRYNSAATFQAECQKVVQLLDRRGKEEVKAKIAGEKAAKEKKELAQFGITKKEKHKAKPALTEDGKIKILCLDDSEMVLNILQLLLPQHGYQVYTANNFSVIHNYIFTEGCKLLLCDVQMPGLSGTKICKLLKASMPEMTIILFSNIDERDLAKMAKESMADGWISKNWKPDEWISKLADLINEI